jgi:hypothetical protein
MPDGMSMGSTATKASAERAIGILLITVIDRRILILDPSGRQPGRRPPPVGPSFEVVERTGDRDGDQ